MPPHKHLTFLNSCAAGHGALTYIALATAFSYIFSDPVFVFPFFTGLYLAAWGLGTLRAEKPAGGPERTVTLILFNSFAGILLATPGIWATLLANETLRYILRTRHQDLLFLILPAGIILTVCLGGVFGARQAAFSRLTNSKKNPEASPHATFWESDHFGASAGILIFAFIFNPLWGLIRGILLSQAIALGVTDIAFLRSFPKKQPFVLKILFLLANLCVLASLGAQNFMITSLDAMSGF